MQTKRAQSANANTANQTRPRRKYTKSVEITVNMCVSRIGKATTQMYMPISHAQKAQDRRALGSDAQHNKPQKKEVMPGLKALRQKRALQANQPEVVSNLQYCRPKLSCDRQPRRLMSTSKSLRSGQARKEQRERHLPTKRKFTRPSNRINCYDTTSG